MIVPTVAPLHQSKVSTARRHAPPPVATTTTSDACVAQGRPASGSVVGTTLRPAPASTTGAAVGQSVQPSAAQLPPPAPSDAQLQQTVAATGRPSAPPQSAPYVFPAASQMAPLTVDSGWLRGAAAAAGMGGSSAARVMRPWFHVTSGDATVVSLEHHAHSGLTAFALSSGEVFVTRPELAVQVGSPPPWLSFVGKLPGAASQICWAPWQYGSIFACCCPGKCAKVFSCQPSATAGAHRDDAWTEELVDVQDCLAVAFCSLSSQSSASLRLVCACARGTIAVCQRGDESFGAWTDASYHSVLADLIPQQPPTTTTDGKSLATAPGAQNSSTRRPGQGGAAPAAGTNRDLLSVSVAEGGSLLACGDAEGFVRLCELQSEGKKGLSVRVIAVIPPAFTGSPTTGAKGIVATPNATPHSHAVAVRHLAWGPSNGRSFMPLAYGSSTELNVILFATAAHFLMLNESEATVHHHPYKRLGGRSMAVAPDRELLKITWNPVGTRISTSHIDGVTRIYALSVTHRDMAAMPPAGPTVPSPEAGGAIAASVRAPTNTPASTDAFYVDFLEVARAVAPSSNLDAQLHHGPQVNLTEN